MLHEVNYNLLLTWSHNNEEQTLDIFALIVDQYVILQWLFFFVYKRQYHQFLHKDGIPDPTSELIDYPVATNSSQQVFVKSQIHSLRQSFFFFFDNLIATTMKVRGFIQTLIILIEESSQCLQVTNLLAWQLKIFLMLQANLVELTSINP